MSGMAEPLIKDKVDWFKEENSVASRPAEREKTEMEDHSQRAALVFPMVNMR